MYGSNTSWNGQVTERRVIQYNVDIPPQDFTDDPDAEILLSINGQVIKRMTVWQANRLFTRLP